MINKELFELKTVDTAVAYNARWRTAINATVYNYSNGETYECRISSNGWNLQRIYDSVGFETLRFKAEAIKRENTLNLQLLEFIN